MDILLCNGLKIFKRKDNVQYLEGYVDPRNIFSIKILEKSGFIKLMKKIMIMFIENK